MHCVHVSPEDTHRGAVWSPLRVRHLRGQDEAVPLLPHSSADVGAVSHGLRCTETLPSVLCLSFVRPRRRGGDVQEEEGDGQVGYKPPTHSIAPSTNWQGDFAHTRGNRVTRGTGHWQANVLYFPGRVARSRPGVATCERKFPEGLGWWSRWTVKRSKLMYQLPCKLMFGFGIWRAAGDENGHVGTPGQRKAVTFFPSKNQGLHSGQWNQGVIKTVYTT